MIIGGDRRPGFALGQVSGYTGARGAGGIPKACGARHGSHPTRARKPARGYNLAGYRRPLVMGGVTPSGLLSTGTGLLESGRGRGSPSG
jgi:hypothetical protein